MELPYQVLGYTDPSDPRGISTDLQAGNSGQLEIAVARADGLYATGIRNLSFPAQGMVLPPSARHLLRDALDSVNSDHGLGVRIRRAFFI